MIDDGGAAFDALPWDDMPVYKPTSLGTWDRARLIGRDSYEAFAAETVALVHKMFTDLGRVDQALLVYCQKDPRGRREGPQVYCIAAKPGPLTPATKQATSMLTAVTARFGEALCIVHMTEAWSYQGGGEGVAAIEAWKKAHGGSMEGGPGVANTVVVTLESYRSSRLYMARIHADPLKPDERVLGAFEELTGKGGAEKIVGRYAHLLSKPEDKPS